MSRAKDAMIRIIQEQPEDITEGIGRSNGSVVVGIIDYRRKYVNCLNQSQFFIYPIDAGIIDGTGPYQNVRIFDFW
ncbi:hypothetical protein HKBW3S34_02234 [Candidatus Hakubella thermalkaliphila]|uniref:Uncharacterized protein n=1 Tax=Candidatus Hakubella thermalkaliphila TaxID=2754717 RepID=A0A6V8PHU2_9ACTN|nr:hypothetical protein HKBW3S34_02234 [Candidatus Hakubella thermalkaliphila]